MLKIVLLLGSLGGGGAERAAIELARSFSAQNWEVCILTYNSSVNDFYKVPEGVKRYKVPLTHAEQFFPWYHLAANIKRLWAIRASLHERKPDIVISFLDGMNELFILASLGMRFRKILSCQVDMRYHASPNARWFWLRALSYSLADQIVFLDNAQSKWAQEAYPFWACTAIPNPLPQVEDEPDEAANKIILQMKEFPNVMIGMGRLVHQKGFDLLIESFARLASKFPGWLLVILGEGPERAALTELAKQKQLSDRIVLAGTTRTPHAVIEAADLFAFSSRYEGQGLALAEAMACGIACVSFDCPSGPSTMIKDQVNGLLVPPQDIEGLSQALENVMKDENLRRKLGREALKITESLGSSIILALWRSLFLKLKVKI